MTTNVTTVPAYAAPAADAPLERTTVPRRPVGEHDVLIEIKYAGICHSDIHQATNGWGEGIFPMVPGHEIAGIVAEAAPASRSSRSATASASAASSTPAARASTACAAWSSTAPAA